MGQEQAKEDTIWDARVSSTFASDEMISLRKSAILRFLAAKAKERKAVAGIALIVY